MKPGDPIESKVRRKKNTRKSVKPTPDIPSTPKEVKDRPFNGCDLTDFFGPG
jgi:hypothetical protein